MALGPGKYDPETTLVRDRTRATGVLLAVIDGDRGSGFSVQGPLEVQLRLPALLRSIADQIEGDTGLFRS